MKDLSEHRTAHELNSVIRSANVRSLVVSATRDDTPFELDIGRSAPAVTVTRSMSTAPFRIIAADHTGITVSNLERSLAFWGMFSASSFLIGPIILAISRVKSLEYRALRSQSPFSKVTVKRLNCSSTLLQPIANMSMLDLAMSDRCTLR